MSYIYNSQDIITECGSSIVSIIPCHLLCHLLYNDFDAGVQLNAKVRKTLVFTGEMRNLCELYIIIIIMIIVTIFVLAGLDED